VLCHLTQGEEIFGGWAQWAGRNGPDAMGRTQWDEGNMELFVCKHILARKAQTLFGNMKLFPRIFLSEKRKHFSGI
jgi:hypothetical protein